MQGGRWSLAFILMHAKLMPYLYIEWTHQGKPVKQGSISYLLTSRLTM